MQFNFKPPDELVKF